MWFSVCSRRTIIERIGFSLLSLLHTFFKDIIICPEFFRIFFSFYEIHIRIDFLIHRVTPFFCLKNKKLSPCNRTRVNHYRFIPPLTHTNIRVPFNGGKPASLTFLSHFISVLSQSKISGSNSGVIFFCFYSHRASTVPDSLSLSTTKYCLHHRFYLALL